jgi:predicted phage terminase large subunit-like protein
LQQPSIRQQAGDRTMIRNMENEDEDDGSPVSIGLIQALQNRNLNVVPFKPLKDKKSRVIDQTDLIEGGSLFLPEKAEWRDAFARELLEFPGGHHDDQVDALVQGIAYQRAQWLRTIKVRPTTGY